MAYGVIPDWEEQDLEEELNLLEQTHKLELLRQTSLTMDIG